MKTTCSRCGLSLDRTGRLCRACKNAYDRIWRARRAFEFQWRRKITPGLKPPEQAVPRETLDDIDTGKAGNGA